MTNKWSTPNHERSALNTFENHTIPKIMHSGSDFSFNEESSLAGFDSASFNLVWRFLACLCAVSLKLSKFPRYLIKVRHNDSHKESFKSKASFGILGRSTPLEEEKEDPCPTFVSQLHTGWWCLIPIAISGSKVMAVISVSCCRRSAIAMAWILVWGQPHHMKVARSGRLRTVLPRMPELDFYSVIRSWQ